MANHVLQHNLLGQSFGLLTVVAQVAPDKHKKTRWLCRCACGREVVCLSRGLYAGYTRSCGCLRGRHVGVTRIRRRSAERRAWHSMLARCYDPKHPSYSHYGAKGIVVCASWRESYDRFFADVGLRPTSQHTLDRIESTGPYAPGNVRWATYGEQLRNRSITRWLTFAGMTRCLTDWAAVLDIPAGTLARRLHDGWSVERALSTPRASRVSSPLDDFDDRGEATSGEILVQERSEDADE